jgi:hypothetical protein
LTSQPFVTSLSQSAKPAAQEILQAPASQVASPPAVLHFAPQAPQ